jgi:hypothetical protein
MTSNLDDPTVSSDATRAYVEVHGLGDLLADDAGSSGGFLGPSSAVDGSVKEPMGPQWRDLVRLHHLIRSRRVTTVLEFGCGWSTVVMAHALSMNRDEFGDVVAAELRRNNPFELHLVDDMPEFIDVAVSRIPTDLRPLVVAHESAAQMTTFGGRICTEYVKLPNITPDFVYVDAPSQQSPGGDVAGISTDHPDRLPMSCDLLKIEHFLLPGTMILLDGRTANARFLRSNFQRGWVHRHDEEGDVSVFELCEPPLGRYNRRQLEFCLGGGWLEGADH